jgi:hypothetical protein
MIDESNRNELAYNNLNISKVVFTLNYQQNALKVNGSIRIQRDSIIILSLQPFLGMEVGRVAVTQEKITVIDRINKQYCSVDFSSINENLGIDANYNMFQAILTNSLFIFDNPKPVNTSSFKEVSVGDLSLLQISRKGINQEFNINDKKQVVSGRLFADKQPYSIRWTYSNFVALDNGYVFPHTIKVNLSEGNKRQHEMDMVYNKVELNKNFNFQFSVPSSYREVTWEQLMNTLQ